MKPVDQEFLHDPDNGVRGDCQRAVIASLLELPIAEVPHFLEIAKDDSVLYYTLMQEFLAKRGLAYLTVPARSGAAFYGCDYDVYYEISGPSPRGNGVYHAVIGLNGKIVHDPHPSRSGLAGEYKDWSYSYLVKTCG